ncbi:bifunctional 5,10-methylenetetrahydrofolate dehydrogenase/5,10-methenyltetrahydrofolate cyclohydrolase [bacterium]|nr:bifunctional 5,10-methylenetetrahydrofolate dehydrogenase/5,10-methenyltetrahydrofolate cyclohydrolase [bacterium]
MLFKGKDAADGIVSKLLEEDLSGLTLAVFHPLGDGAAESYLKTKEKWLKKINAGIEVVPVDEKMTPDAFFSRLEQLNKDSSITGIMVELPLPLKISETELLTGINPLKDVDAITYFNQGKIFTSKNEDLIPCTSAASIKLLEHYRINFAGKNVLVIGRSYIVGLPLFKLFLNRNATPAVAHRGTSNLKDLIHNADIVAVCAGTRGIVKSSEIKDGASIVDVGIHVTEDGKVVGDMIIDQENEESRINYSPVPGGVGTVTNAMMLYNLVQCRKLQKK